LAVPLQSHRAGFDQQLARLAANGKAQEIEAFVEADDARLGLVEGQPLGRQPSGQPGLDLFSLLPGVAQGDQVVRRT
jgi:hypothetical protein